MRGRLVNNILIGAFLVLISGSLAGAAEMITIAGDPCTVPLAEKLGQAFTKKTGTEVKVESAGCANGIYKASTGDVSIGVSTHEVDLKSLPLGTTNTVIAKAPTVILVNKANPVNNLTLQQVKDILSGKIKNWKDAGGKDLEIKNVLLQPCTTAIFSKKTAAFGSDINRLVPDKKGNPVAGTNKLVEENEGAMGLQICGYESPNVKVITIDGYLPDENIFPAKYGFYQDYNVITKGEPAGSVKAFIDFAMSPEGQGVVASMKHIRVKK